MLTIDWSREGGWEAPKIIPHGPISIHTSATALHYGISCYEGISVVKNKETDKLQGFRVDDHLQGFADSTAHLDMPSFDQKQLKECLKPLIQLDREWIDWFGEPDQFYTRLLHISTDKTLGVRSPATTKIVGILNPIKMTSRPISLKCSRATKSWPLGHGSYRISGNMGPLVPIVSDAKSNGFDDVLWLLDDYIKEATTLNVFVLQQSRFGWMELVTPPDDTCIMNGVTRQTILDMKDHIEKKYDLRVVEREISVHEVINSGKEGRLFEVFGGATHCHLVPFNRIVYQDTTVGIQQGEVRKSLSREINGIMRGDDSKWITKFE